MPRRYTPAALADAAANSTTWSDMCAHLGLAVTPGRCAYLRNITGRYRIDTDHIGVGPGATKYTRDVLEAAVAASTNFTDVLRHLSLPIVGGSHAHISRRIRAFGIDTTHFSRVPRTKQPLPAYDKPTLAAAIVDAKTVLDVLARLGVPNTKRHYEHVRRSLLKHGLTVPSMGRRHVVRALPDTEVRAAVAESISIAGVLARLGVPVSGATHRAIKQRITDLGLDTSHFLGQGHLRGTSHPSRRSAREILVHDPASNRRPKAAHLRRALADIGVPTLCTGCGTPSTWRGRPMTLEVDHINGDWRDNRRENLRLLCPNCHATTDTYCGGRRVR